MFAVIPGTPAATYEKTPMGFFQMLLDIAKLRVQPLFEPTPVPPGIQYPSARGLVSREEIMNELARRLGWQPHWTAPPDYNISPYIESPFHAGIVMTPTEATQLQYLGQRSHLVSLNLNGSLF